MSSATKMSPPRAKLAKRWIEDTEKRLKGRTIVGVRWMGDGEIEAAQWQGGSVVLILDDGSILSPQCDDEGNDCGALTHTTATDHYIMPVF